MPASIIAFPASRIAPPPPRPAASAITFGPLGRFQAMAAAEAFLRQRGFSFGPMEGVNNRGIRFARGEPISKWTHMGARERLTLHGKITGDMINGPVTVEIFASAPEAAKAAFAQEA